MSQFPIHTVDTAPESSRPALLGLRQAVGMIPNLAAGMAEAPTLLRSFLTVREEYQKGTLTGGEIQVLSIVAAVENDCGWCVAFHSLMSRKAFGLRISIVRRDFSRTMPLARSWEMTRDTVSIVRPR